MDAQLVAKYLTTLKEKSGLTYEVIADKCGMSVVTVKNLFTGRTEDPRLNTVAPITYILNGSVDEMYTGKSKSEIQEISLNSIKEICEQQLLDMSKTHEAHVNNIRSHYEQHIADLKENYERRLTDKREINKEKDKRLAFLTILNCIGFGVLIGILILEVLHPDLGWIRF